jgi:hypothetical protein
VGETGVGEDMDSEQRLNQLILDIQSVTEAMILVAQPFCEERFKGTLQGQVADYLRFIHGVLTEAAERALSPETGSIQGDLDA